MTKVTQGKNAAIRQIMRERAAKKVLPKKSLSHHPPPANDTVDIAVDEHHNDRNSDMTLLVLNDGAISRTVTFEDEIAVKDSNSHQPQHHRMLRPPSPIEVTENIDTSSAQDSSLSSSHWALMEYDIAVDVNSSGYRNSSPWNQHKAESLMLELLTANTAPTRTARSPPPFAASQELHFRGDHILHTNADSEISGTSWNDCDDHNTQKNSNVHDVTAATHERKYSADNLRFVPSQAYSLSPKRSSKYDTEKLPSAPNGSPFTTFRHNSTSIALDETEVYLQKIHDLEQQLKYTQNQLLKERQKRTTAGAGGINQQYNDIDEDIPPTSSFRTPASKRSHGRSRPRSFSASAATPQTPASTLSTRTTDTLWERNKTLITEIRFADQTCVELSYQKSLLEDQLNDLQMKNDNLKETNQKLLVDIEAFKARSTTVMESDQQKESLENIVSVTDHHETSLREKKDLMDQLLDSREQIALLRDEVIENFESYKDETCALKDRITHLVSELNSRQTHHDIEKVYQGRIDELIEENHKLRQTITEHEIRIGDEQDRTVEIVQRAMNSMKVQYESLQSTVSRKCSTFDARFGSLSTTIQYMEDAMLQCDNDKEDTSVASKSSLDIDNVVHYVAKSVVKQSPDVRLETVDSGVGDLMNATLTHGPHNQTMDLAMMEEARVDAIFNYDTRRRHNETMDLAMMEEARAGATMNNNSTIDEVQSPDPNDSTTPNNNRRRYHFDGISRILLEHDMSFLPSPPTDNGEVDVADNAKFLQHVQWLTSTASPIEGTVNGKGATVEKTDDMEHSELLTSRFHHGFKNIQSNLSYSESEDSSTTTSEQSYILSRNESTATMHINLVALSEAAKENVLLDHSASLHVPTVKEDMSSMLDESLNQISKLHIMAHVHECSMLNQEESLVMEKFVVEKELEIVEKAIEEAKEVSGETAAGIHDDQLPRQHLDSLLAERSNLTDKLKIKSSELQGAIEQISILKADAIKRENLMIRYEELRREQEVADFSLREKSIFPRKVNAETNTMVDELYEQIDTFRQELLKSTTKIDTLTRKFDVVEAEKTEQIAKLDLSLNVVAEERDSLRLEIAAINRSNESLLLDKELQQELISNQSSEIERLEDCIGRLQRCIDEAQEDSNELRRTIHDKEEIYITSLDTLRHERDEMLEKVARMSEEYKQLEDAKQRVESKLIKSDEAIVNAEVRIARTDAQASKLREEMKEIATDLQNAKEVNKLSVESFRQETELRKKRDNEIKEHVSQLLTCRERIESLEIDLQNRNISLKCGIDDNAELRRTNDNLSAKCSKLRDYIRTVTKKCHQWETFHDRETKALKHLHHAYHQSCRKASELTIVCHKKDQRVALLEEARRDLENEIEEIARELVSISQYEVDESVLLFEQ